MHITGGDDVVPRVNLIDTVDVEEIIGVLSDLPSLPPG
jgi:hypothetical protein